jgi:AmiR/NasT family two-component response regulator
VVATGTVNTNAVSTNTVTYTATDGNGNTNTAARTVIVRDTTPPTILWSFTNLVLTAGTNCTAAMPAVTGTNYLLATDLSGTLTLTQVPTNSAALPLGTNVVVITVADASGNASYSTNEIIVLDRTPPVILLQPQSQTNIVGASAGFSVTAAACTPLTFQWYFDNTTLAAQTNSTLTLSNLQTNAGGNYLVVVTASGGSATSSVATLILLLLPPTITVPPLAQTVQCGSNANFTVTASGTPPLNYQWSLDSVPIAGATSTGLSLTNVHLPTHTVAVVVTNPYGGVTSPVPLTVQDTLPPVLTLNGSTPAYVELGSAFLDPGATAYDLCAGTVPVVATGTVNTNAVSTNTVTYTATDDNGNTNTATRTVIVRDTTPPTILWSFTNLVLAAGTNCTAAMPDVTGTNCVLATDLSGTLTLTQVPTNTAALPLGTNVVVITVADASGNASYSTNEIIVQDQTPPMILLEPQSQTNTVGASAGFSVTAAACTPLAFQWYFDNTTLAAQTNGTLTLSNLQTSAGGNYLVVVTAAGGSSTSSVATLTVLLPPTITVPPSAQTVQCGSNAAFSVTATGTPPLNYQWRLDGVPIAGATDIALLLTNVHLPTHTVAVVVTNPYGGVTSSVPLTVQDTVPPVLTLNGSTPAYVELGSAFLDPGATAYDLCAGTVPVDATGTVNTNAVSTNTVTYTATDGNGNTNTATRTVIVRDTTPPTILWSFTNLVLAAGTNCTAAMPDVTGTNYLLATDLSGALTVTQVPTNNAALPLGTNVVVITVTDASGNASYATNEIIAQDQTPPIILLEPQSQTNTVGASAGFSVKAAACTPLTFQWYFDSTALAAQTNNTLSLSNLQTSAGGNYLVVVTASGGSATSAVATLTVNLLASSVTLASSENPAGLKDSLIFTATVAPTNAAGTVQFLTNGVLFDVQSLAATQAVTTNIASLPRGTNIVTAIYSGDANDIPATNTLAQIVTNHPPAAADALYSRAAGSPLYIAITNLATYWSDVDGDTVSVAAVGVSTNGVTVTNNAGTLVYINSNDVPDQFVCTITDGWGGTNFQTVNISVVWLAITRVVGNASGSVTLDLTAAPGFTYILERSVDLVPPLWSPVATNTLGTNGYWQFTDAQATNSQRGFYRLKLAQ